MADELDPATENTAVDDPLVVWLAEVIAVDVCCTITVVCALVTIKVVVVPPAASVLGIVLDEVELIVPLEAGYTDALNDELLSPAKVVELAELLEPTGFEVAGRLERAGPVVVLSAIVV